MADVEVGVLAERSLGEMKDGLFKSSGLTNIGPWEVASSMLRVWTDMVGWRLDGWIDFDESFSVLMKFSFLMNMVDSMMDDVDIEY